jgi:hypothetical protein
MSAMHQLDPGEPSATAAPARPAAGQPGVRLIDDDAASALERFEASSLMSDGLVNLVALDAIRDRLGERWGAKREQIYDHMEKVLRRNLGHSAYFLRVSDTDFIVAQPGMGPFGAQASCLRCLSEALNHFLGEARHTDLFVHQVTKLTPGGIEASIIDPVEAAAGEAREITARKAAASVAMQPRRSPEQWSPFVSVDGRRLRVSCNLEPVFELKGNTRIGYRMARRVLVVDTEEPITRQEQRNLSRADLLRVDLATIARGLQRVESESANELSPSLIIPVSFVTLSSHQGRAEITKFFKEARESVAKGVICEVVDIEGVPQGPLLSAISLIKPFSLFVVGHLMEDPITNVSNLKGAGLQAISLEKPPHVSGDLEFSNWLRQALSVARTVARSVILYACESPRQAAMASMVGVTHASFRRR